jgi:hypothetical protein
MASPLLPVSIVSASADPQTFLRAHALSYRTGDAYCAGSPERLGVGADPRVSASQSGSPRDARDALTLEPAGSRSTTEEGHAPSRVHTGTATGSAAGNAQNHVRADRAAAPRSGLAFGPEAPGDALPGLAARTTSADARSDRPRRALGNRDWRGAAGSTPAWSTTSITSESRGKAPAFERCAVAGENSGRPGRLGIGSELGVPTDDGGPAFPTVAGAAAHQSEAA